MQILLLEDDVRLSALLLRGLRREGHAVDHAATIEDGRWMATESPYDVMVFDVMLPDGDGYSLCRDLRSAGRDAGRDLGRGPAHRRLRAGGADSDVRDPPSPCGSPDRGRAARRDTRRRTSTEWRVATSHIISSAASRTCRQSPGRAVCAIVGVDDDGR